MTLLLQILWTLLAAMTVENLLLPGTLGFSRMLRAARKPEHRAWYAIFVGIFSAISLEMSLLIPPQLFPAYANVLRPFCLALCAAGDRNNFAFHGHTPYSSSLRQAASSSSVGTRAL